MIDLKELIERELAGFLDWSVYNKSIVTTASAKLFAEHVAQLYAESKPAPDVSALVEALSIARDYVFSSLEEKKMALAGYPQMWRCEQDDLAMIDATLSAYRKETNHDK